jgi:penicillin-binding protein 1A
LHKSQRSIIAKIERQYTKNEIIAMYCNVCDFGNYSVGVSLCCTQTYFSKTPKELTIDESAILVGMFKTLVYTSGTQTCKELKNHRMSF